jgi:hypothetical protein
MTKNDEKKRYRQNHQARQLTGRQMSCTIIFVDRGFLTRQKIGGQTRTLNGRLNVQKLQQQLTARLRYAGNLLHWKI